MKDRINYPDFAKLDFRIGQIIKAQAPEWSEKLLQFEVDFGVEIGKRTIFSGIRAFYKPEDIEGKKYVFVVNMEKKKMGSEESDGMLIMADTEEKPILLPVPDELEPGAVVR
jgi:tRNA-binding protein